MSTPATDSPTPSTDPQALLRRSVYWLLIAVSAGVMVGRILAVDSVDKLGRVPAELSRVRKELQAKGLAPEEIERELQRRQTEWRRGAVITRPFLSANDRSRWCTVRALVEDDMRVEGAPYAIDKVIAQPNWDTIDMASHGGHLYSSKPPLGATLIAGPYWVIHRLTGATLGTHPYEIGRFLVIVFNVIPLVIGFALLARLVERFGTTDWGRLFVVAAACFGTFLTTFAVVINNHVPAAVSATLALSAAVPIWFDGQRRLRYFAAAGLFSALTAASELPALALFAATSAALLWRAPRQTLVAYVPAALLVAAGFFGTNWIAHQSLRPPYMHRSEGDNWYHYTYQRGGKQYTSYWQKPSGIDCGEASRGVYALHTLVGHHGIFSLTPIWLLSLVGLVVWFARADGRRLWHLALLIASVSAVCLLFYLLRPEQDRNYGGTTSGFRWAFWFAPLWLLAMAPAVDLMARRRWRRGLALVLLALSALSASYPTWNPWSHPWIMDFLQYLGWIRY